jgi:hypothetical protein
MNEKILAHCNKCMGDRNHQLLFTERNDWHDDEGLVDGAITWALIKCLGCDDVRLKHQSWFSEDMDIDGTPNIYTNFYPPSVTRQKPIWQREFFPFALKLFQLNSLSEEIYDALGVGAYRLATMGIRALVEKIMIDSVGDKGNFEKNISAFFIEGFVAPKQQDIFKNILIEAGHAAMHRNFKPDADVVNTLLDMVEGIMRSIYYEPMVAEQVNKAIPRRK